TWCLLPRCADSLFQRSKNAGSSSRVKATAPRKADEGQQPRLPTRSQPARNRQLLLTLHEYKGEDEVKLKHGCHQSTQLFIIFSINNV
uniref:Uncharacterized protein n=1 Tax=Ciona intestinalis TaxID=7719 RepID=H2Y3T9_CIOIN